MQIVHGRESLPQKLVRFEQVTEVRPVVVRARGTLAVVIDLRAVRPRVPNAFDPDQSVPRH